MSYEKVIWSRVLRPARPEIQPGESQQSKVLGLVGRSGSDELLEPRSTRPVELVDDRSDGRRLAEVDAGLLEERHRMVAAAGRQQLQVTVAAPRASALGADSVMSAASRAADAKQVAYW